MSKIIRFTLLIVLIVTLTSCASPQEVVVTKDMSEYGVTENSRYIETTAKEAIDLIKTKKGVMFFGYEGCGWCQLAVPILNETLLDSNSYTYYLDVHGGLEVEELNELTDLTSEFMLEKDGKKVFYVPYVIAFDNGKTLAGMVSVGDDVRLSEGMNEKQTETLKNIYLEIINLVKEKEKR